MRRTRQHKTTSIVAIVALTAAAFGAAPATAQVGFDVQSFADNAVCNGLNRTIYINADDDCESDDDTTKVTVNALLFGPQGGERSSLNGDGTAYFANTATFGGNAVFNGTATFNGSAIFNGGATYSGSISANGITSSGGLGNTGLFTNNGNAVINGSLSANSLSLGSGSVSAGSASVSGQVSAGSVFASGQVRGGSLLITGGATFQGTTQLQTTQINSALFVANGATVNMGGNRVQGVGGPVAGTDAANKDYVDNAVAGVSAGVAQAAADNARQDQELNAVRADNTRQDQELNAVRTVNTRQDQELADVRTVNAQQATQITAAQTANTRQDQELTDVRAVNTVQAGQISAIQALDSQQAQQIGALQTGQAALFDLADKTRRDLGETNEGVAMALALESPALPAGTNFALSGGIGYFSNKTAVTTAITTRIGRNASWSAGVGVGLNSGKVGARSGFQVAW